MPTAAAGNIQTAMLSDTIQSPGRNMPVHLTVKLTQTAPSQHSNESDTRHFYSYRNRDNLNLIAILLA